MSNMIKGSEGIIIVNKKYILLGMQKQKRWYQYNDATGALIKTIGGSVEENDKNSECAVLREINEELYINSSDIRMRKMEKQKIKMGDLNPFDSLSNLEMEADFYFINYNSKKKIKPRDLPYIFLIPIGEFLSFKENKIYNFNIVDKYSIKGKISTSPEYISFFIPKYVFDLLRELIKNENCD